MERGRWRILEREFQILEDLVDIDNARSRVIGPNELR
jgi:hypothetical protein